ARLALEPAPARCNEWRCAAADANAVRHRLPPVRGLRQSRRDRAHDGAHARDSPAIAAVGALERRRAGSPGRPPGHVPDDVDCTSVDFGDDRCGPETESRRAVGCGAGPCIVARLAGTRMVVEPTARKTAVASR